MRMQHTGQVQPDPQVISPVNLAPDASAARLTFMNWPRIERRQ
jgi:hypothetical protein